MATTWNFGRSSVSVHSSDQCDWGITIWWCEAYSCRNELKCTECTAFSVSKWKLNQCLGFLFAFWNRTDDDMNKFNIYHTSYNPCITQSIHVSACTGQFPGAVDFLFGDKINHYRVLPAWLSHTKFLYCQPSSIINKNKSINLIYTGSMISHEIIYNSLWLFKLASPQSKSTTNRLGWL